MEKKEISPKVHMVARLTLEALRRLSSEGKNLGLNELTTVLGASKDLDDLLAPGSDVDRLQKKEMLRLKKELGSLKDRCDKVDMKRRELADQLDALEVLNSQIKAFARRSIPTLAQLARSDGGGEFSNALDRLTKLLKKDAPVDELESAFQSFKDLAFQEEVKKGKRPASPPKMAPIFNLFKRRPD